ncbi:MAG: Protein SlyX [Cellvibrionales bacterium UBA7375]|nr:MAG: Protein SlyX [Cellvibrionales bacterium UBA7375]
MDIDRLDTLEEKLAYLEASNAELSDEIFRQQQEIAALTKAHHQAIERLQSLEDTEAEAIAGQGGSIAMDKPPHY